MRWSWPHAIRGAFYGFVIGRFLVAAIVLIGNFPLRYAALVFSPSLAEVMVSALLGGVVFGIKPMIRERTIRPNEGVRQTARRALSYGSFFTVVMVGAYALNLTRSFTSAKIVPKAIILTPLFFAPCVSLFGGVEVVRHYALRVSLAVAGHLPLRAVRFLDCGVSLVFLRRVGGGYVFIHRMLLDYFAELPAVAEGSSDRTAGEGQVAS